MHAEGHRFEPGILHVSYVSVSKSDINEFFDFSIRVAVLDLSGLIVFIKLDV